MAQGQTPPKKADLNAFLVGILPNVERFPSRQVPNTLLKFRQIEDDLVLIFKRLKSLGFK